MGLQNLIALSGYTIIALGSYIIVALRECLILMIKPIKQETFQRMRWFFLILITLWLVAAMALPGVTFILTRNPLSFTLLDAFAPPISITMRIIKGCKKRVTKPTFCSILPAQSQAEERN